MPINCRGIRIAIEVKKSADAQVVLNNLLKHSKLQTRFSANMVALLDHRPRVLNLRDILQHFIDFRLQVLGGHLH
jgi:DNA gyrase subunit A